MDVPREVHAVAAAAESPGRREGVTVPEAPDEQDSQGRLGRSIDRLLPAEPHAQLLWLLVLASLLLRLLWLARPDGSLIFDESYYVNAVRVIIGIPPAQNRYADKPFGLDPNTEHPPLAKLIVAGSMSVLGDNAYGWRLPSVAFGTVGIVLVYGIVRRLQADPRPALPGGRAVRLR
jgi:Dolichyl-phosphate-mannose-protein mannosyltransferase